MHEGARGRDLFREGFGRDDVGCVLCADGDVIEGDRHGHAQFVRRQLSLRHVFVAVVNGVLDRDVLALGVLLDDPRLF